MKRLLTIFTVLFFLAFSYGQKKPKVILVTLDGLRWQEVFSGADELLISNEKYVSDISELETLYWSEKSEVRRKQLMPFTWSQIVNSGQIYGNRKLGSKVNLTNKHWFSYPGYNEILTGREDDTRISSNQKIANPNRTILEIVNNDKQYFGKVAAFASWDVFPFIINEGRSGVLVNAGFEEAVGNDLTANETYLNKLQTVTPSPWSSVRLDVFTHHYALEVLTKNEPDLLYIAYGETDDFAHHGDYDAYLKAATRSDQFINELWDFSQNHSAYKNNTIFIITTDHGRGTEPLDTWRSHGSDILGADQTWLMVFGNGISSKGEISKNSQLYANQIAAYIAKIFDVSIDNAGKALPIETVN